jgi:hypothetical protein
LWILPLTAILPSGGKTMQGRFITFILLSLIFTFSCTVGEKYSENNSTNNNNTNNVNNINNTNNVNNVNPDIPTSQVEGYWHLSGMEVTMDTISGTQVVTLGYSVSSVVDPDGDEHFYSIAGNMHFTATDDNNGSMSLHLYTIVDEFLNNTAIDPLVVDAVVTSEDSQTFTMVITDPEGTEITFDVNRGTSNLTLTYIESTDGSAYAGPTKLNYDYEGASPQVFLSAGSVNNMMVEMSDDATVLLTDATYVEMNDGYFYTIQSEWASDNFGVIDWSYSWDYSSDGVVLESTRSEDRVAFLGDDGFNNYSIYFIFYESGNELRRVSWKTTHVENTDGSFTFTVIGCYDTDSAETDKSCQDNWPYSFDLIPAS